MSEILIKPLGDGYEINIDGTVAAACGDPANLAVHLAYHIVEMRRLRTVINEHASWMHSRTPDQYSKLEFEEESEKLRSRLLDCKNLEAPQ